MVDVSRQEFLKVGGALSVASLLAACGVHIPENNFPSQKEGNSELENRLNTLGKEYEKMIEVWGTTDRGDPSQGVKISDGGDINPALDIKGVSRAFQPPMEFEFGYVTPEALKATDQEYLAFFWSLQIGEKKPRQLKGTTNNLPVTILIKGFNNWREDKKEMPNYGYGLFESSVAELMAFNLEKQKWADEIPAFDDSLSVGAQLVGKLFKEGGVKIAMIDKLHYQSELRLLLSFLRKEIYGEDREVKAEHVIALERGLAETMVKFVYAAEDQRAEYSIDDAYKEFRGYVYPESFNEVQA